MIPQPQFVFLQLPQCKRQRGSRLVPVRIGGLKHWPDVVGQSNAVALRPLFKRAAQDIWTVDVSRAAEGLHRILQGFFQIGSEYPSFAAGIRRAEARNQKIGVDVQRLFQHLRPDEDTPFFPPRFRLRAIQGCPQRFVPFPVGGREPGMQQADFNIHA